MLSEIGKTLVGRGRRPVRDSWGTVRHWPIGKPRFDLRGAASEAGIELPAAGSAVVSLEIGRPSVCFEPVYAAFGNWYCQFEAEPDSGLLGKLRR